MNLKKDQNMYTVLCIIGIVIVIAGLVLREVSNWSNIRFIVSGLAGIGGALIAIGGINLFKIKKRPQKYGEEISAKYDERNNLIRGYAGYATFVFTFCIVGIASIILLTLDYFWLFITAIGIFLIQIISFWIFVRYYNNKL